MSGTSLKISLITIIMLCTLTSCTANINTHNYKKNIILSNIKLDIEDNAISILCLDKSLLSIF